MRILFFLHKIGPYHHARFVELSRSCELVVVEILPASAEYAWHPIDDTTHYLRIRMENSPKGKELKGKMLINAVNTLVHQHRPHAIITMGWSNRTYMAAILAAKKEGIPVFSMSDSTYSDTKRYAIIEQIKRYIVKSFDGFVTAGRRSEQYLIRLGVSQSRIFKPMDVVDNKYFSTYGSLLTNFNYSIPYLLCLSRFILRKNLHILIEAYDQYIQQHPEEKTILYIIGSGPLEDQLREKIQKLRHEQIRLLPFVQYEYLPSLYHHARGLILASTSEQWGLVVNEAMAAGLPVMVSNRCGCVDDLVVEGVNGWSMEPTTEGIFRTLEKFFKQPPEVLKQMGQRGREIISHYDLKNHRIAVLSMIENALHEKNRKWKPFYKLIVTLRIYL